MKPWHRIALTVVVVAALTSFICLLLRPREPPCRGKTISAWLEQYFHEAGAGQSPSEDAGSIRSEAETAICEIGTNPIPYLLKLMATKKAPSNPFKDKHWPVPTGILQTFGIQQLFERRSAASMMQPHKAWLGFTVLGPEGRTAVSRLSLLMRNIPNVNSRRSTAYSLGAIGRPAQNALPDLMEAFKDSDPTVRDATVSTIFAIAFDSKTGQFQPECSRLMVSGLGELLADPKTDALRVLRVLSDIGPDAKAALSATLPFQNSEDSNLRAAANKVRERIAPAPAVQIQTPNRN